MGISLGLDCRCCGSVELIIRVINFEPVQPICMPTIHQRHGRTDGRTTYDGNTALVLRATRGKTWHFLDSFGGKIECVTCDILLVRNFANLEKTLEKTLW